MSFDMINSSLLKNKEVYEVQKAKNLKEKDLGFPDIKLKYDKFMNKIFGEIKRSEKAARLKQLWKNSIKGSIDDFKNRNPKLIIKD